MQYREHLYQLITAIDSHQEDHANRAAVNTVIELAVDLVVDVLANVRRIADALEAGNELQREILAKMDKR